MRALALCVALACGSVTCANESAKIHGTKHTTNSSAHPVVIRLSAGCCLVGLTLWAGASLWPADDVKIEGAQQRTVWLTPEDGEGPSAACPDDYLVDAESAFPLTSETSNVSHPLEALISVDDGTVQISAGNLSMSQDFRVMSGIPENADIKVYPVDINAGTTETTALLSPPTSYAESDTRCPIDANSLITWTQHYENTTSASDAGTEMELPPSTPGLPIVNTTTWRPTFVIDQEQIFAVVGRSSKMVSAHISTDLSLRRLPNTVPEWIVLWTFSVDSQGRIKRSHGTSVRFAPGPAAAGETPMASPARVISVYTEAP